MKTCSKCGNENPSSAIHCMKCGTFLGDNISVDVELLHAKTNSLEKEVKAIKDTIHQHEIDIRNIDTKLNDGYQRKREKKNKYSYCQTRQNNWISKKYIIVIGVVLGVIVITLGLLSIRLYEKSKHASRLQDCVSTIEQEISNVSRDTIYCDWVSTNHGNGSQSQRTYQINAQKGDVLSLGYTVFSESCCDSLSVILVAPNNEKINLVKKAKGKVVSSTSYSFEKSGIYSLKLVYSKDNSISYEPDMAAVTNIRLRRNTDSIINSIYYTITKSGEK